MPGCFGASKWHCTACICCPGKACSQGVRWESMGACLCRCNGFQWHWLAVPYHATGGVAHDHVYLFGMKGRFGGFGGFGGCWGDPIPFLRMYSISCSWTTVGLLQWVVDGVIVSITSLFRHSTCSDALGVSCACIGCLLCLHWCWWQMRCNFPRVVLGEKECFFHG